MVKASVGGGGRGLPVVRNDQELLNKMEVARREAVSSAGNGEIFLEKYIERPHHIEFQILADKHGNIIHLGERDCSPRWMMFPCLSARIWNSKWCGRSMYFSRKISVVAVS